MKSKILIAISTLLFIVVPILFNSCTAPYNYFQVYKTEIENGSIKNNLVVFEDEKCQIRYDLWNDGGNLKFSFYNKSDNDLILHLNKTFFVLNGVAYEYYQNRTFSNTQNNGTSIATYTNFPTYWNRNIEKVEGITSNSFSVAFAEKPYLTIPSNTSINISEYKVTNSRFINCDLPKIPNRNNFKTLKYDKQSSPFVFYNLITYSNNLDTFKMENKFYVSEIANLPSSNLYSEVDTSTCGRKLDFPIDVFKKMGPNKFYVKYTEYH